jgi:hypothetical protein
MPRNTPASKRQWCGVASGGINLVHRIPLGDRRELGQRGIDGERKVTVQLGRSGMIRFHTRGLSWFCPIVA